MTPTLLAVGATGNTGRGVVDTIMPLLKQNKLDFRVLGTTRDAKSESSTRLSRSSGVEMVEIDWKMIDAQWLKEHDVRRVFIASHNNPSHFIDESLFLNAALEAGVEYVVRISTTRQNIGPATRVSYARGHWAIETMLETPEFDALQWTSLQPNCFTQFCGAGMIDWIKTYRETGEKKTFLSFLDEVNGVATVDSLEIGVAAAHLLAQTDISPHNKQKYIVNGPSDLSGKDQVRLIEKLAKTTVDDVRYRDTEELAQALSQGGIPANVIKSTSLASESGWDGSTSVEQAPTSAALAKLYAPKNGAVQQIEKMVAEALG